ncbi:Cortical protein marker for cell polarity [Phycisphaerae bacterium RAS1]|nr:Cortical protein marker for cell polarity [Phycisphaerae bacterium RAS1]
MHYRSKFPALEAGMIAETAVRRSVVAALHGFVVRHFVVWVRIAGALTAMHAAHPAAAQNCQLAWSSQFGLNQTWSVYDAVEFDDGSGPKLFVAGHADSANGVARWDGDAWTQVGSTFSARTLADYNGTLYAGGQFGSPASNIVRWNGASWSAVDSGTNGSVLKLLSWNGSLYACGTFTTAGGVSASVARWNGTSWAAVGTNISGVELLSDLCVHNNELHVCGKMRISGGTQRWHVARWNGATWSAVGGYFSGPLGNDTVLSIQSFGDDLYAGGSFMSTVPSFGAHVLARWNGSTWNPTINSLTPNFGFIQRLESYGGNLYAGGWFSAVNLFGGDWITGEAVFAWDGTTAVPLDGILVSEGGTTEVSTLKPLSGGLLVAGSFQSAGSLAAIGIAYWTGTDWSRIGNGQGFAVDGAHRLATGPNGVYAAGNFHTAGPVLCGQIARWDGAAWHALSSGVPAGQGVTMLSTGASQVYLGGTFSSVGGVSANRIAQWDGNAWSALGQGLNNAPNHALLVGDDLFVTGAFTTAGGQPANLIARWDGAAWQALGSGLAGGGGYVLAEYGGKLHVGGQFTSAGGGPANHIAAWDGAAWSALASGVGAPTEYVSSFAVFGDGLYAGGRFSTAGGTAANSIARWNGVSWSPLGAGIQYQGTPGTVSGMAVYNESLYCVGPFTTAGGQPAANVARWNGVAWSAVSGGATSPEAIAVFGGRAYVAGGPLTSGGGIPASGITSFTDPLRSLWIAPTGGQFDLPGNWQCSLAPTAVDPVLFDNTLAGYPNSVFTVTLVNDAASLALLVRTDTVTVNLSNRNFTLTAPPLDGYTALVVGALGTPGIDARLKVVNTQGLPRSLGCGSMVVADVGGCTGRVTVQGPTAELAATGPTQIGKRGQGFLLAQSGADVSLSHDVILGAIAGAAGDMTADGVGSVVEYGRPGGLMTIGDAGSAALRVLNGGQLVSVASIETMQIASQPASSGGATLSGPATVWLNTGSNFVVGGGGTATLRVEAGAQLLTDTSNQLLVARDAGSSGTVTVTGPGSRWLEQNQSLIVGGSGSASVNVSNGGVIELPSLELVVQRTGVLEGDGAVSGDVTNLGEVRPRDPESAAGVGTLSVAGSYRQLGPPPGGGAEQSGRLIAAVAGANPEQVGKLAVTGPAELGGGLFVNLINNFDPPAGQPLSVPLVSAAAFDPAHPRFDVAFFPGITGSRFLKLSYPSALAGGEARGGDILLAVADLAGQIDVTQPQSAGVLGVPNAVAVGDLNSDGMDDIVLTAPDAANPTSAPGSVFVLLTAFDGGGAYAPTTAQYTVGVEPAAVAVGQLDGSAGIDLAVANAGDDNVTILTNNGGGVFSSAGNVAVGNQPRGVCIGDFDQANGNDIVVALDGDDNILTDDGVALFMHNAPNGIIFVPLPGGVRPTAPRPRIPDPFDPDGDKDLDLGVIGGGTQGAVNVYVNNGMAGGAFDFLPGRVDAPVGRGPVQLVHGDLNQSGGDDIATINQFDGTVSVLVNTSSGSNQVSFAPAVDLPVRANPTPGQPDTAAAARSITVLDLDQDNDLDLVLLAENEASDAVARILRNDLSGGQLAFAPATDLDAGTAPLLLAAADLNADTRDDLVVIDDQTALAALRGGAPGRVDVRLNAPAPAVVPGDLNCDGAANVLDINPFVLALSNPAAYQQQYPGCPLANGDVNVDGNVDVLDINPFVALLAGG